MADKYQTLVSGVETMREATVTSTGVSEAGDIVALDSDGRLSPSVMPVGIAADVKVAPASENLSAGEYVNFWNDAGTTKVRKADSTNGRDAHGFVKSSVTAPANASVYFEGENVVSGPLTPGARQYLTASGAATETPPTYPTDTIHQFLGIAVSTTAINTDIDDKIVLA